MGDRLAGLHEIRQNLPPAGLRCVSRDTEVVRGQAMSAGRVILRVLAVLIALRALTNVFKPLGLCGRGIHGDRHLLARESAH